MLFMIRKPANGLLIIRNNLDKESTAINQDLKRKIIVTINSKELKLLDQFRISNKFTSKTKLLCYRTVLRQIKLLLSKTYFNQNKS